MSAQLNNGLTVSGLNQLSGVVPSSNKASEASKVNTSSANSSNESNVADGFSRQLDHQLEQARRSTRDKIEKEGNSLPQSNQNRSDEGQSSNRNIVSENGNQSNKVVSDSSQNRSQAILTNQTLYERAFGGNENIDQSILFQNIDDEQLNVGEIGNVDLQDEINLNTRPISSLPIIEQNPVGKEGGVIGQRPLIDDNLSIIVPKPVEYLGGNGMLADKNVVSGNSEVSINKFDGMTSLGIASTTDLEKGLATNKVNHSNQTIPVERLPFEYTGNQFQRMSNDNINRSNGLNGLRVDNAIGVAGLTVADQNTNPNILADFINAQNQTSNGQVMELPGIKADRQKLNLPQASGVSGEKLLEQNSKLADFDMKFTEAEPKNNIKIGQRDKLDALESKFSTLLNDGNKNLEAAKFLPSTLTAKVASGNSATANLNAIPVLPVTTETPETMLQISGMNGDRVSSIQNNPANLSLNAAMTPFSQGLSLKNDFAPNLAMRLQWIQQQAMSSAEILMDPPELGPLSVKLSNHRGETQVHFQVSNPQTKEMIEENLDKLKDMLAEQGINLGDTQVEQRQKNADDKNESSKNNESTAIAENEIPHEKGHSVVQLGILDTYI